MLSEKQIELIKKDITADGMYMQTLQDDLLDHICCYTEDVMKKGLSFEEAYVLAKHFICPEGFKQIQQETIELTYGKSLLMSKRLLHIIGLVCSMLLCIGFLFKIFHLKGAEELLVSSLFGFAGGFVPTLAVYHFINTSAGALSTKMGSLLGVISVGLIVTGYFAYIKENQWGVTFVASGILLFTFIYLPYLFYRLYRQSVA